MPNPESRQPSQRDMVNAAPKASIKADKHRFDDVAIGPAIPVRKERQHPVEVEYELDKFGALVPSGESAFEEEAVEVEDDAIVEEETLLVDEAGVAELEEEQRLPSFDDARKQEVEETKMNIAQMQERVAKASGEDAELLRKELIQLKDRFNRLQDLAKLSKDQREIVDHSGVKTSIINRHKEEVKSHKGGREAVFTPRDIFVPVLTQEVDDRTGQLDAMGFIGRLRAPGRQLKQEKTTFEKLLGVARKSAKGMESK